MNKKFCKKVCKHEVHCVVYVHAETWKKLARRLIFPGSALLFTTLLYDECAHGWLDGLNRLFMEAEPDLCYCFLLKTLEPLVLPILQKCIYLEFKSM